MAGAWQAPYRPAGEITQRFEDGTVDIYTVTDEAVPGYRPRPKLAHKVKLRYEERRLGIQRYYTGMQNQVNIQRVVRVPRSVPISSQDVARTEDGIFYRIDLVQAATDTYPPSADLTLAKVSQNFDIVSKLDTSKEDGHDVV